MQLALPVLEALIEVYLAQLAIPAAVVDLPRARFLSLTQIEATPLINCRAQTRSSSREIVDSGVDGVFPSTPLLFLISTLHL